MAKKQPFDSDHEFWARRERLLSSVNPNWRQHLIWDLDFDAPTEDANSASDDEETVKESIHLTSFSQPSNNSLGGDCVETKVRTHQTNVLVGCIFLNSFNNPGK